MATRRAARRYGPDWAGPWTVLVVDRATGLRDLPGLAALLAEGPEVGVTAVCVDGDEPALPTACAAVARIAGDAGTRVRIRRAAGEAREAIADQVDAEWAEQVARSVAPLVDAAAESESAVPASCRLIDVLGVDPAEPDEFAARWASGTGLADTVLGLGADGPVRVDLGADGPHALVAGTTGAGKSELLQTLVIGLAVGHPPDEIAFLLIDYKGGAAFADCARLPHTAGLVTDLDPHLTRRALQSLNAELRRRERLFAAAGVSDLDAYRARVSGRTGAAPGDRGRRVRCARRRAARLRPRARRRRPARTLAGRPPRPRHAAAGQRGQRRDPREHEPAHRAAGHRPGRVAGRHRNCRRRRNPARAPGAWLPAQRCPPGLFPDGAGERQRPGRTRGCGGVGRVAPPSARSGSRNVQRPRPPRRRAAGRGRALGAVPRAQSLARPLPTVPGRAAISRRRRPTSVPIGALDLPTEQARTTMRISLAPASAVLVVGAPRSGRTGFLVTAALGAAAARSPAQLQLHVIDAAGALAEVVGVLPAHRHLPGRSRRRQRAGPAQPTGADRHRAGGGLGRSGFRPGDAAARRRLGRSAGPSRRRHRGALCRAADRADPGWLPGRAERRWSPATEACSRPGSPARSRERFLLRLPDRGDYGMAGVAARDVPAVLPPGRGIRANGGAEIQFAHAGVRADPDEQRRVAAETSRRWGAADPASGIIRIRPLPDAGRPRRPAHDPRPDRAGSRRRRRRAAGHRPVRRIAPDCSSPGRHDRAAARRWHRSSNRRIEPVSPRSWRPPHARRWSRRPGGAESG